MAFSKYLGVLIQLAVVELLESIIVCVLIHEKNPRVREYRMSGSVCLWRHMYLRSIRV